jgi:hypothetical protein
VYILSGHRPYLSVAISSDPGLGSPMKGRGDRKAMRGARCAYGKQQLACLLGRAPSILSVKVTLYPCRSNRAQRKHPENQSCVSTQNQTKISPHPHLELSLEDIDPSSEWPDE